MWRRQGFGAVGGHCTTRFENTHKTVRREVLYAHHPWFAHEVWVHAVIEKADGVFFRCTLDGTETDRFLEIPAWMFDRAWCSQCHVTTDPSVSLDTLRALSSLLDFGCTIALIWRLMITINRAA